MGFNAYIAEATGIEDYINGRYVEYTLTLGVVKSSVSNSTKNIIDVEFTRPVTITDTTDITLSFDIGTPKTVSSVSGSGTDTLSFTISSDIKYGDILSIVFGASNNIQDTSFNSLGSISSFVDTSAVQQISITSSADLQHWFTIEDISLLFESDGTYPENTDPIYSAFDYVNPLNQKLANYESGTPRPTYDSSRGAASMSSSGWFQTYSDDFDGGAGGGSITFEENAGDFHDFLKAEVVTGGNIMFKNSKSANRGFQIVQSTGVANCFTSTSGNLIFPTSSTKMTNGNTIIIEVVRYGTTIEAFVTDSVGRESLGTVTDSGSWPGTGQTINNRLNSIYGTWYFYQLRCYSSDQRSNYTSIHTEMGGV